MAYSTSAAVHRFGDELAIYSGNGETVYLDVKQARRLYTAIGKVCRSIENESFQNSPGLSVDGIAGRSLSDPERVYKIVRLFENSGRQTVKTGLTLSEAQSHCQDPETSSRTATGATAMRRTANRGAWFDGYETI